MVLRNEGQILSNIRRKTLIEQENVKLWFADVY